MTDLLEDGTCAGELWQGKAFEEPEHSCCEWYFRREYIESSSPSRQDGIDAATEAYLRRSYCTFLQDLGMRLKVPQLTIATAIMFCHRFFLRASHAKNDRFVIATVCMFLAGKVEETPKLLQNVICVAYEIRHRKDPEVLQRIKLKEVQEQEKELTLLAEYLVLSTLEFDLNIHHPYKPLAAAIKKLKVAQHALAQVAWNFINDGLRTSLCLQFKAHQLAAGAIFLAAKFLKVKLPSNGKKPWWQEFDVTPRQLEDVSNQMLELYEQNREIPASRPSGSMNHDKKTGNAPPPGTPQVVEKRSTSEVKPKAMLEPTQRPHNQGEARASSAELEQVNIEKLKTAVEKRRKLKAEGGGMKSKLELTDEEELLEREIENEHKDGRPEHASYGHLHKHSDHHRFPNTGSGSVNVSLNDVDEDLEIDNFESPSQNKPRHSQAKDYHHTSQIERTDKVDHHHRRPKSKDIQEREHKRSRHDNIN